MANFNPNAPGVLGNEWFPTIGATWPVAENQSSFCQQVRSTTAQTIAAARMAIESNSAETDPLFTLLEVIPAGDERPSISIVDYAPDADETIGSWVDPLGGTSNLFSFIDDAVVFPPVGGDYIINISGLSAYRASVNSGAFPLTARVTSVYVRAVVGLDPNRSTTIPRTFTLSIFHQPTSQVFQPPGASFTNNGFSPNPIQVNLGEINPVTDLPWTPDDIRSFDGGDWHIRITAAASAACGAIVTAMALRVNYVTTENRVAVGTWQRPAGALARVVETDDFVEPDGSGGWATNWAKPGSGDFLYLWRRANGRIVNTSLQNATDIAWLHAYQDLGPGGNPAGISFPPVPGMIADQLAIDNEGLPTVDFEGDSRRAARLILRTSAPADSVDSQPYFVRFDGTVLRTLHSTQSIGQLITPGATNAYLGVKLVVLPPGTADGTLTVRLFNASTGAQVGTGQFQITADEVRALPKIPGTDFRYVEGFLSTSASLVNATQYEIRATTDVSSSDPWLMSLPNTESSGTTSFGGTANCAQLNGFGGTSLTGQDAMLQVLIQPTAPANVDARTRKLPYSGGGRLCTAEAVDQITVSWSPTSLLTAFDRYEIERLEDDGGVTNTWHPVGVVTSDEQLSHWTDTEPARNRPVKYRVRVVANTTAFSDWAETSWVRADSYGASMIFTSNAAPDMTVAVEWEPQKSTDFPDHDTDEVVPLFGEDLYVAFMEPEDRGIIVDVTLIVHAVDAPCDDHGTPVPDDHVWDALRAISRASLPYVCVLDHRGNRTYGKVTLKNGRSIYDDDDRLSFYTVDATITPLTFVPTPVEV